MDLAAIYDDYLVAKTIEKDRDPLRLFVTDVGKCPRAVALRMTQAEKKHLSVNEMRNQRLMWDLAEYIEKTLADALELQGLLVDYQFPIPIEDRENWGGRGDILTDRIIEVKTIRSQAFRFTDRPKKEHVYQASIYEHYLEKPATLIYFDRGGANTPEQYEVESDWATCSTLMDELEAVRAGLPEVPGILPRVLKKTDRNTKIRLVPDWRCGYCDYAGKSCKPHESTETWADLSNGLVPTKKADMDVVYEWALSEADEALLEVLR